MSDRCCFGSRGAFSCRRCSLNSYIFSAAPRNSLLLQHLPRALSSGCSPAALLAAEPPAGKAAGAALAQQCPILSLPWQPGGKSILQHEGAEPSSRGRAWSERYVFSVTYRDALSIFKPIYHRRAGGGLCQASVTAVCLPLWWMHPAKHGVLAGLARELLLGLLAGFRAVSSLAARGQPA